MRIEEKYTTQEKLSKATEDKALKEQTKLILSNDAYAISETMELLIGKINQLINR